MCPTTSHNEQNPSNEMETQTQTDSQTTQQSIDRIMDKVENSGMESKTLPLDENDRRASSFETAFSVEMVAASDGSEVNSTQLLLGCEDANHSRKPSILGSIILQAVGDKHVKIDLPGSDTSSEIFYRRKIGPQVLAAIAVSLGSMIIGFGSAYTSTALPSMTAERNSSLIIDKEGHEASWIGSLLPLGAIVGGIIGGTLVEVLGRKNTILATSGPFILSWLLIALATNVFMIYAARAILGFCIGVASLSLPVYLAETVQPEVRGTLGLLPTTIGNMGVVICFICGTYLDWDYLAYLGAALCIPFLIAMFFIPETPRWYIAKGKEEKAQVALQWLRGSSTDIRTEFNEIKNTHLLSKKYATTLKDLLGKTYIKPLFTSLGLMFFQQFSGINAVIFYSVDIFQTSGSSVDAYLSTIILGLVNIAATIGATLLIDRLGRKVLLVISDLFMLVCLLALGVFFYYKDHEPAIIEGLGFIPLVSLMVFVVAFSLGLMMGEIFPGRIRGSAAATATAFNWTCTFIVTKAFPEFSRAFGGYTAFLCFSVVCFLGLFFIIFCVPETQGKSLDDIERNLSGRPFRRISSAANFKPFPTIV